MKMVQNFRSYKRGIDQARQMFPSNNLFHLLHHSGPMKSLLNNLLFLILHNICSSKKPSMNPTSKYSTPLHLTKIMIWLKKIRI